MPKELGGTEYGMVEIAADAAPQGNAPLSDDQTESSPLNGQTALNGFLAEQGTPLSEVIEEGSASSDATEPPAENETGTSGFGVHEPETPQENGDAGAPPEVPPTIDGEYGEESDGKRLQRARQVLEQKAAAFMDHYGDAESRSLEVPLDEESTEAYKQEIRALALDGRQGNIGVRRYRASNTLHVEAKSSSIRYRIGEAPDQRLELSLDVFDPNKPPHDDTGKQYSLEAEWSGELTKKVALEDEILTSRPSDVEVRQFLELSREIGALHKQVEAYSEGQPPEVQVSVGNLDYGSDELQAFLEANPDVIQTAKADLASSPISDPARPDRWVRACIAVDAMQIPERLPTPEEAARYIEGTEVEHARLKIAGAKIPELKHFVVTKGLSDVYICTAAEEVGDGRTLDSDFGQPDGPEHVATHLQVIEALYTYCSAAQETGVYLVDLDDPSQWSTEGYLYDVETTYTPCMPGSENLVKRLEGLSRWIESLPQSEEQQTLRQRIAARIAELER